MQMNNTDQSIYIEIITNSGHNFFSLVIYPKAKLATK